MNVCANCSMPIRISLKNQNQQKRKNSYGTKTN
nr:MAG TPA: Malignant T-cell-amplified sequence 1, Density-regulated initiation, Ribosome, TRANSLATION [Caudoviricetes sp.]